MLRSARSARLLGAFASLLVLALAGAVELGLHAVVDGRHHGSDCAHRQDAGPNRSGPSVAGVDPDDGHDRCSLQILAPGPAATALGPLGPLASAAQADQRQPPPPVDPDPASRGPPRS